MRIAFFSDIHANLPALEAVLADLDARQPDMLFCLGDLVGYAPWPNEVVETIRRRMIPTLAGNYDEGVGLGSPDCGCAYKTAEDEARGNESIAYTNQVITEANRQYLNGLPRHLRIELQAPRAPKADPVHVLMVHGSPRKVNQYLFEDFPERSLMRMMEQTGADVLLFGHTHKPYHRVFTYESNGETRCRHAINIGSVGKPKDGDPRACYAMMEVSSTTRLTDAKSLSVSFVRVAYDVERAAQAVEASPLPNPFADMLRNAY